MKHSQFLLQRVGSCGVPVGDVSFLQTDHYHRVGS
jgi:hypothetical protein